MLVRIEKKSQLQTKKISNQSTWQLWFGMGKAMAMGSSVDDVRQLPPLNSLLGATVWSCEQSAFWQWNTGNH